MVLTRIEPLSLVAASAGLVAVAVDILNIVVFSRNHVERFNVYLLLSQ